MSPPAAPMARPQARVVQAALAGLLLVGAGHPAAQTGGAAAGSTPTVQQMIDALKPGPARSRNLLVRPAAPAEAAQPAAQAATEAPPDDVAGLSLSIPFETGSAQLLPSSGPVLGELVAALMSPELKDSRFVIEGHTDARGIPAANLRLSQQRAEEVRQFLVALGVHPSRLRAVGRGSSDPVHPARPDAPENRRVRVVPVP